MAFVDKWTNYFEVNAKAAANKPQREQHKHKQIQRPNDCN